MSEWCNNQKKSNNNVRQLLQERIEKVSPRRELNTKETKRLSKLEGIAKIHNMDLHIVNISTGAAVRSIPTWAAYCSSKAAAKIFLDCLGDEEEHVQFEHIDPGVLNTAMQNEVRKSEIETGDGNRYFSNLKETGGLLEPAIAAHKIINTLIGKKIL